MSDNDFKAYYNRVTGQAREHGRADARTVPAGQTLFPRNHEAYGRAYASRPEKDAWTAGFTAELARRTR